MMSGLLLVVLIVIVAWTALRWLPAGAEARAPLPYLIALIPLLWLPSLLCAIGALWIRQWWLVVVAIIVTAAVGLVERHGFHRVRSSAFASRERSDSSQTPSDAPADTSVSARAASYAEAPPNVSSDNDALAVPVMTLNCRYGQADARQIVDAVKHRRIMVLALQELTGTLVDQLDAAGLGRLLPHRVLGTAREDDNGGFNGLWSSIEPTHTTTGAVDIHAAEVPGITVALPHRESTARDSRRPAAPARTISIVSAHPKSPMRGSRAWSAGIIALSAMGRGMGGTSSSVIMGDLNSHIDHPSFRRLLAAGFRDANRTASPGSVTSYPQWLPWPRIELDHVLANAEIGFHHVSSFPIEGSDHRALTATLVVPGRRR